MGKSEENDAGWLLGSPLALRDAGEQSGLLLKWWLSCLTTAQPSEDPEGRMRTKLPPLRLAGQKAGSDLGP